jgi:hypothetical protein
MRIFTHFFSFYSQITFRMFCKKRNTDKIWRNKMENSRTKTILIVVAVALIALIIALSVGGAGRKAKKKADDAAGWAIGQIAETNVTGNLTFPTKYDADERVKLSWTSDKANIISDAGVFAAPEQDTAVKLTCKATYKNKSATKEKTVTAKTAQPQSMPYSGIMPFNNSTNGNNNVNGAAPFDNSTNGNANGNAAPYSGITPFNNSTNGNNNANGNRAFGNLPYNRSYNRNYNTSDMFSGGNSRYSNGADGGADGYNTRYNNADNTYYINTPRVDRRAYRRQRNILNNPNVDGSLQSGTPYDGNSTENNANTTARTRNQRINSTENNANTTARTRNQRINSIENNAADNGSLLTGNAITRAA